MKDNQDQTVPDTVPSEPKSPLNKRLATPVAGLTTPPAKPSITGQPRQGTPRTVGGVPRQGTWTTTGRSLLSSPHPSVNRSNVASEPRKPTSPLANEVKISSGIFREPPPAFPLSGLKPKN